MKKVTTLMLLLFTVILMAQDKIYVHTATAENISGNITLIDHPDLNNNPNAGIVYSQVSNPGGGADVYNNNSSGLFYLDSESKWTIYNEGAAPITENASYYIYISDASNVIEHISVPGNTGSFGNPTSVIDDPLLNGDNPGPITVISKYWNPNEVNNPYNYGFYYDNGFNRRGIFVEGASDIPEGAAFKILINGEGDGVDQYRHIATPGNSNENFTALDHPDLNGNPDATFVFTHYWGANGAQSEVGIDAVFAAHYTGTLWTIANEDGFTAIPDGMLFDVIIAPQEILGVNDNELSTSLSLYPNPANDYFTVSTTLTITKVSIYNMLGQQIKIVDGNEANSVQINVSELAQGNYFAKVEAEGSVETIKFIKK